MKNEKKIYEDLQLEIVRFDGDDIITTSNEREVAELEEIED